MVLNTDLTFLPMNRKEICIADLARYLKVIHSSLMCPLVILGQAFSQDV